jgi:hypothetical protein
MASTFEAQIAVQVALKETADAGVGGQAGWQGALAAALALTHGTVADKFDLLYTAERNLASAATDSIDLRGVLTSPLGIAMAAVELAALIIINKPKTTTLADNTTSLTIGAGSNKIVGLFDSLVLPPGGFARIGAGSANGIAALAAGTADLLQVVNGSGAANNYQICALGRSA